MHLNLRKPSCVILFGILLSITIPVRLTMLNSSIVAIKLMLRKRIESTHYIIVVIPDSILICANSDTQANQ